MPTFREMALHNFAYDNLSLSLPYQGMTNNPSGYYLIEAADIKHEGKEHVYALVGLYDDFEYLVGEYLKKFGKMPPSTFDIIVMKTNFNMEVFRMHALRVSVVFVPEENISTTSNVNRIVLPFADFING